MRFQDTGKKLTVDQRVEVHASDKVDGKCNGDDSLPSEESLGNHWLRRTFPLPEHESDNQREAYDEGRKHESTVPRICKAAALKGYQAVNVSSQSTKVANRAELTRV